MLILSASTNIDSEESARREIEFFFPELRGSPALPEL